MKKGSIAVIGAGSIGTALVRHVSENMALKIEKISLFDIDKTKSEALASSIGSVTAAGSAEEAAEKSDLIVECAQRSAVEKIFELAMDMKKDLMVLSVGGLLGKEELLDRMDSMGLKVILPSGAVAGIDAVKAARIAGIEELEIVTRKSPRSLKGAPYLERNNIDLSLVESEQVLFQGTAAEAIEGFPKNVNISVLLSIAGIGPEKTKVKIIVSPAFTSNTHQVRVKSPAGEMISTIWNVPSPDNPRTSYMASLSAMAALEGYFSSRVIGT